MALNNLSVPLIRHRKAAYAPSGGGATNRSAISYWLNADSLTVGDPAPATAVYWLSAATVSNTQAYSGTKSIKCPFIATVENQGFGADLNSIFTIFPNKGDTVWTSFRQWSPLTADYTGGPGWPGFTKWLRYRTALSGVYEPANGAIYTQLAADGAYLSAYEGFPDPNGYVLAPAGSGPTLGSWMTMEHCVVFDDTSVDGGGLGEQRYYINGVQKWRRTDQKTLVNATDHVVTMAWIDFLNGAAVATFDCYIDDLCIAGKIAGVVDDTPYLALDANGRPYIGM